MSEAAPAQTRESDLPLPHRYITTHDAHGKSVFYTGIPSEGQRQPIRDDVDFFLQYTTSTFPVQLNNDDDIRNYQKFLDGEKPGLIVKGGSVLRICSFGPDSKAAPPMHRTMSIDYGIVIAGEMECLLDSGEVRHLKVGDILIQRETNHAWRNPSKDKWARMVFILQEATPLKIGGLEMKEEYGSIPNVRPSS